MGFNQTFTALLNEAKFTNEMLGAGATQIRKADHVKRGVYFQSFTSLSTGLERIGKLCFMLNYYIDHDCQFPNPRYLKNEIGHKINVLYDKAVEIKHQRSINHEFMQNLDTEIHRNIITVLTRFAVGDRYSNIDILMNNKQYEDPITSWVNKVDIPIYEKRVSQRMKEKVEQDISYAYLLNREISDFTFVMQTSETGEPITNIGEMARYKSFHKSIAVYRQLYVVQIIRFWVELLVSLQRKAQSINNDDIPWFSEIFLFCVDDAYIKTRKTWDTNH